MTEFAKLRKELAALVEAAAFPVVAISLSRQKIETILRALAIAEVGEDNGTVELIDDLDELRAHFEDRADIDDNGNPNFAMKSEALLNRTIAALSKLKQAREG